MLNKRKAQLCIVFQKYNICYKMGLKGCFKVGFAEKCCFDTYLGCGWNVNLQLEMSLANVIKKWNIKVLTYPICVNISLNCDPSWHLTFFVRWQFLNKLFLKFSETWNWGYSQYFISHIYEIGTVFKPLLFFSLLSCMRRELFMIIQSDFLFVFLCFIDWPIPCFFIVH